MKTIKSFKLLAVLLMCMQFTWMSCNNDNKKSDNADSQSQNEKPQHATATLSGTKPDTTVSGTVTFDEDGGKVKMNLQISVPTKANQTVAVHIHENGACGDMGKAAGGHWNPTNQNHGKWGSASFHLGDIGNVTLDDKGNGQLQLETDLWSIGGDTNKNILQHC